LSGASSKCPGNRIVDEVERVVGMQASVEDVLAEARYKRGENGGLSVGDGTLDEAPS
jgi:hypothetical protein